MASIERTAYPRFSPKPLTESELHACYELTPRERRFIEQHAHGDRPRLTLMVLLKTRQHLGYFPMLPQVPEQIRHHLAKQWGLSVQTSLLDVDQQKKGLYRYRKVIRTYLPSASWQKYTTGLSYPYKYL